MQNFENLADLLPAELPLRPANLPAASLLQILDASVQALVVHRGAEPMFVNRTMMDLAGIAPWDEESMRRPVMHWIHPDDRTRVAGYMQARMAGRPAPDDYEFRLRRLDGGDLWISCRAAVIDWMDGPAILASCFDITPHKRLEVASERTETLFRRVFQATPVMVSLSFLETGIFLDVNDNLAMAIGRTRKEILGQSIFDLGIWDDPMMVMRIRAAIRRHGSIRRMEGIIRRTDGSSFPSVFSAETLEVDGAEVLLIIGRDISEEKRNEAALLASRDQANLANRAKSEFLATMSHELRTPLNAILGFSEIIRDGVHGPVSDPRYSDYAADIHRSGSHLLQIINDILDISKIEAGRLEIAPEVLCLDEALEAAMRLVRPRVAGAGLELCLMPPAASCRLYADTRIFRQILLNLLSNAIKFTPQGRTVELRADATPDGGCRITVRDTGIGMSEEEIVTALTPFGQVDSGLTRRHDGTGLGLPLVAAFVEAHGGRLDIVSEKGVGTSVSVTFPPAPLIGKVTRS